MNATEETPIEIKRAIGRLFLMMSRPYQSGDEKTYWDIVSLLKSVSPTPQDTAPNYARNYPIYQETSL